LQIKDMPASQWQSYASQLAKLSFKGHDRLDADAAGWNTLD